MGNAIDEQDDSVALVAVSLAAVVVLVRERGSTSDAGVNSSSGTICRGRHYSSAFETFSSTSN
jgi:hypothetical protein